MKRRALILPVCLTVLAATLAAGQTPPAPKKAPAPPALTVQPITKALYLVKGGAGANAAFFVTPKQGVVVIDAKMTPEAAAGMLAEIAKVTPQPVATVIITHSDGDHINGLPGLPKALLIFAHENVKRDMEKAAIEMPALKDYLPTQTYATGADLIGWDYDINMRHFGPAHTDGDTCVLFPDLKVAFVGDLLFVGRDPLIHRHKNGSSFGYVKTLEALLAAEPAIETFLSGHADPLGRADVQALRDAMADKQAKVKAMVDEGKGLEEVKKAFGVEDRPAAAGGRRWLSLVETIYLELTEKK